MKTGAPPCGARKVNEKVGGRKSKGTNESLITY